MELLNEAVQVTDDKQIKEFKVRIRKQIARIIATNIVNQQDFLNNVLGGSYETTEE